MDAEKPHEAETHLTIVWTTADPLTAKHMVMVYATNALKNGWWKAVTVLIWGASQKLLLSSDELQSNVHTLEDAGVVVKACRTCSDGMGITQDLEHLGLTVERVGQELTESLKGAGSVITV